ncbi:hypothetical protein GCM10010276_33210 [Streptomyces longisporus]|uniref:Uncharacterized protein n=1 Tax=Streptomyces longisporus TaxID=1948 RepID=A0ABP5Z9L9_STRLO
MNGPEKVRPLARGREHGAWATSKLPLMPRNVSEARAASPRDHQTTREGAALRDRKIGDPVDAAELFNVRMNDALWDRLPSEDRREIDELVAARRHIKAIALMRERVGLPRPDLRDCVDLLEERARVLRGG